MQAYIRSTVRVGIVALVALLTNLLASHDLLNQELIEQIELFQNASIEFVTFMVIYLGTFAVNKFLPPFFQYPPAKDESR